MAIAPEISAEQASCTGDDDSRRLSRLLVCRASTGKSFGRPVFASKSGGRRYIVLCGTILSGMGGAEKGFTQIELLCPA